MFKNINLFVKSKLELNIQLLKIERRNRLKTLLDRFFREPYYYLVILETDWDIQIFVYKYIRFLFYDNCMLHAMVCALVVYQSFSLYMVIKLNITFVFLSGTAYCLCVLITLHRSTYLLVQPSHYLTNIFVRSSLWIEYYI